MRAKHIGTHRVMTLVLLVACCGSGAAQITSPASGVPSSADQRELRKLELEAARLEDDKSRTRILRETEDRLAKAEPSAAMRLIAILGTPLSIVGSIGIGYLGYRSQARATRAQMKAQTEALEAQFRLKAAELIMSSKSSDEIANRAKALAAMFPHDLGKLGADFRKEDVNLSQGTERRQTLIGLLAAHPGERKRILEAWALMFPWDANNWLRPLLEAEDLVVRDPARGA